MTERKPAGVGLETWIERQIREAQERGEFEACGRASSEAEVRRILGEVNARIEDAIRRPMSGPPLNLMPFDVEHVVAVWRASR
ncbi:hypothetical protein [Saccharothrix longispora]|uniref:hypothetical protein n=1 Tax=Saccharothrix longispora TaxID=33920 RepID=UPI0028FD2348|nr:hypothetical protein [Saccharothrix longispora]MBY8850638.1 DUF1992 domain-containing protein [Saccharothrix sp. MB29]MDU0292401.1 hypothetical protein [Saccharothrix longispora]